MEQPINILIVDDEPKNLTVLETVLDDPGYRLVRAGSADDALLALVVEEFALIILDIRMPGMTGFELAQVIKERKRTARVPIIFLTAYYNEDQHVLEGYGTGAVDYLHKPVNPAVLRSKVAVFAELYRKQRECSLANRALLAEVTERRRAEEQMRELNATLDQRVTERAEALRESEQRLRAIYDGTFEYMGLLTADGTLREANRASLEFAGSRREDVVGLPFWETVWFQFTPGAPQRVRQAVNRAAAGEFVRFETPIITPAGETKTFDISFRPVRDERGNVALIVPAGLDITDRKIAEQDLMAAKISAEQAKAGAEAANKAKDHFLAVLSHELRTPLTPVLTELHLMEAGGELGDEIRESLRMIRRNVELEVRLIDDLLDLTRIVRGNLILHTSIVDLREIQRRVNQICQSDVHAKSLKLHVEWKAQRDHVRGDAARLQQILWNLLKNAIKFTPDGGTITVQAENPAPDRVAVTVADSGVGITPALLPHVFNAFEQGETGREFGGLGLGLAISKQMAELHGGTLTARSEGRNQGAAFTLELGTYAPTEKVEGKPRTVQREGHRHGSRILLVEDHLDTSKAMNRLLERWGYKVRTAGSVGTALQLADAEEFDLVLSDIALPDGSGLELMRQLVARRPTKGIAFSGYGMEADVRRSEEAGFTRHLTKPVDLERLQQVLQEMCAR